MTNSSDSSDNETDASIALITQNGSLPGFDVSNSSDDEQNFDARAPNKECNFAQVDKKPEPYCFPRDPYQMKWILRDDSVCQGLSELSLNLYSGVCLVVVSSRKALMRPESKLSLQEQG